MRSAVKLTFTSFDVRRGDGEGGGFAGDPGTDPLLSAMAKLPSFDLLKRLSMKSSDLTRMMRREKLKRRNPEYERWTESNDQLKSTAAERHGKKSRGGIDLTTLLVDVELGLGVWLAR